MIFPPNLAHQVRTGRDRDTKMFHLGRSILVDEDAKYLFERIGHSLYGANYLFIVAGKDRGPKKPLFVHPVPNQKGHRALIPIALGDFYVQYTPTRRIPLVYEIVGFGKDMAGDPPEEVDAAKGVLSAWDDGWAHILPILKRIYDNPEVTSNGFFKGAEGFSLG